MADDPTAEPDAPRVPPAPSVTPGSAPPPPSGADGPGTWSRRGCLTAAGVVGALVLVGVVVLVVVLVVAKGWLGDKVDDLAKERQEVVDETGIETGSTDVDHPPQRDIRLGACEFDDEGGVQASGTLTNWTESTSDYRISLSFRDGGGRGPGHRVRLDGDHRRGRRGPRHDQLVGLGAGAARGLLHLPGGADRPLGLRRGAPRRGRFLTPEAATSLCHGGKLVQTALKSAPSSCRQNLHAGAVERRERHPGRVPLVGDRGRRRRALRRHDGRLAHRLPRGPLHARPCCCWPRPSPSWSGVAASGPPPAGRSSPPVWCCSPLGDGVYALPWDTDIGTTGLSWADPLYVLGSFVLVAGALRLKSAHVGEGEPRGADRRDQHRPGGRPCCSGTP